MLRVAAPFVLTVALAACSSSATSTAPTTATAAVTTAPTIATTVPPTPAPSPPTTTATTTPSTPSDSTEPSPTTTATPTTELADPPDDDADPSSLPLLPDAATAGVPVAWATADFHPGLPAADLEAPEADPLLDLSTCADGGPVLARPDHGEWASRRFTAPADPRDDGLLQVEVMVDRAPAGAAADPDALAARWDGCSAGPDTYHDVDPVEVDGPIGVTGAVFGAPPTAALPYPSIWYVAAVTDGHVTVSAILSGLDSGGDWSGEARRLARRVFDSLDEDGT